jgi:hypothetical protein
MSKVDPSLIPKRQHTRQSKPHLFASARKDCAACRAIQPLHSGHRQSHAPRAGHRPRIAAPRGSCDPCGARDWRRSGGQRPRRAHPDDLIRRHAAIRSSRSSETWAPAAWRAVGRNPDRHRERPAPSDGYSQRGVPAPFSRVNLAPACMHVFANMGYRTIRYAAPADSSSSWAADRHHWRQRWRYRSAP